MRTILLALALLLCFAPIARAQNELHIFNWDAYLDKEILEEFTKRTGIKVTQTLYDSNEAMMAKVAAGVATFDLVVPTQYAVPTMVEKKMLREIDKSKIANWKNLDPRLMGKSYDPENKHAVPYFYGTTGIGYNKAAVGNVDSWQVMFDAKYSGKIMLLNDVRECFGIALRLQGKSVNEKDAAALRQAGQMLKDQKKLVKAYDSDNFAEELRRGSVVLAQGFNGQIAKLMIEEPGKFGYAIPREGSSVWIDNICIPANARNVEGAHAFISFLLDPEIGARIVNTCNYSTANLAAREKIKPQILNNPAIYTPDDILKRCDIMEPIGKAGAIQGQIWRQMKSE